MALVIILTAVAGLVAVGLLAARYGADSRQSDPRDVRPSWL
jgi:hypothetical protein